MSDTPYDIYIDHVMIKAIENRNARDVNGELYCLRCHDKMGIPICGACR